MNPSYKKSIFRKYSEVYVYTCLLFPQHLDDHSFHCLVEKKRDTAMKVFRCQYYDISTLLISVPSQNLARERKSKEQQTVKVRLFLFEVVVFKSRQ